MCLIIDNGLFGKNLKEIFPDELELRNEIVSSTKASFLEIDEKIKDNKVSAKLTGKLGPFPIEIVRISFFNSNMPSKIVYFSIGSEILGVVRNTRDCLTFKMLINKPLEVMRKHGRQKRNIKILVNKVFGRSPF